MNKLNEIIESENLKQDQNNTKEMSEMIIKAHKGYKKEIVKTDVENLKQNFNNFVCNNELTYEELEGARKFLLFMLNNINNLK
ncbi:MAG: hypothetical protein ACRCX8_08665 [Sarcina sp.]